ncbi:MAG: hypothetical protein IJT58_02130 [Synergistaceae bacterium]|nr:hypothetical protein [Synergistaceae bacterium]
MELDECNSRNHLDLIANVRPIVTIGEPQSVEGQKTKGGDTMKPDKTVTSDEKSNEELIADIIEWLNLHPNSKVRITRNDGKVVLINRKMMVEMSSLEVVTDN